MYKTLIKRLIQTRIKFIIKFYTPTNKYIGGQLLKKIKNEIHVSPAGSPTSTLCQLHSNHHTQFISLKTKVSNSYVTKAFFMLFIKKV